MSDVLVLVLVLVLLVLVLLLVLLLTLPTVLCLNNFMHIDSWHGVCGVDADAVNC